MRKYLTSFAAFILLAAATLGAVEAKPAGPSGEDGETRASSDRQVRVPLNLAVLVQDDLVSRVGTEIELTRDFIRSLPRGSRVMVGYVRAGSLQVRQPFTSDLDEAARALRVPVGSTAASPYNPYVEVREALGHFKDVGGTNRNALLLISDGLDVSRGFDFSSSVNSIDLLRAIRVAKEQEVAVYTFYAPSVGLTSWNRTAIQFGQSALNRLARETGGAAFFQGTSYVTFDPYFRSLSRTLNERHGAY